MIRSRVFWHLWQGSGFHPNVHANPAGAIGTEKELPATAHGLGIDPTDPTDALGLWGLLQEGVLQPEEVACYPAPRGGAPARRVAGNQNEL